MRKMGELMKDLGFREEASDEVKEAFIKNLIKSAYGIEVNSSKIQKQSKKFKASQRQTQFAFDFGDASNKPPQRRNRKSG